MQRTEEELVQAKLMRKELDEQKADDEKMDEVEARIAQSRGNGSPLPDQIRQKMEQQFGKDFSRVVIHTDMQSDELCKELNARAFAIGNDIYFATGEFNPDSERGQELLAHELTHVVQQNGKISRKDKKNGGEGEKKNGFIEFETLKVPPIYLDAYSNAKPLIRHKSFSDNNRKNDQKSVWQRDISITKSKEKIENCLPEGMAPSSGMHGFLVPSQHSDVSDQNAARYVIGSIDNIARELSIPSWNKEGNSVKAIRGSDRSAYQVDHIVEQQVSSATLIGNFRLKSDLHEIGNFQLLRDEKNKEKMKIISNAVRAPLKIFKEGNVEEYGTGRKSKKFKDWGQEDLLKNLSVKFLNVGSGSEINISNNDAWQKSEIEAGDHIDALITRTDKQIKYISEDDIDIKENHIFVIMGPSGGTKRQLSKENPSSWADIFSPFTVETTNFEPSDNKKLATLKVNIKEGDSTYKRLSEPLDVSINRYKNSENIGFLPLEKFQQKRSLIRSHAKSKSEEPAQSDTLENKLLCPLTTESIDITEKDGLVMSGKVLPSFPIISNADIRYTISGENFSFSKTFSIEELSLPSPIEMNACDLTVSAGSSGLSVSGLIDFTVDGLGNGFLEGSVGTDKSLALEGGFDFDSELFDRASIKMWYREGKLGGEGEIGIDKPDKIKGIKSANVKASYDDGTFSATGEVKPALPAIEQGTLELNYSEEEGLDISGEVQIAKSPGIRSGKVNLRLRKQDENWKVSGEGTAQPDIPGIDSELTVGYEDGGFVAEFSGGFERGMLSGDVTVGVSNRAVGEDGKPSGDPLPGGELLVYGSGSATIQIAPWLQGTAGVKFDPNGEVTVSGEIGIPDELEIFARKEINKTIFQVAVQVPIIPGIVAEVGGGLSAIAGIGPGVIDELKIGIEYNPAREQDTKVTGDAHLRVPADAGLRLSVRAGIGLGITGASATGGLDIGGTLGISGAATAGVHIDWTPATGLDLTADLEVYAQPSFTFDIGGYVSVKVFGWSVYDDRFEFASYTFGSDYRFGIKLPVHYKEGEPFDISTDDIEFEIPDISTNDLLKGLISRIT